METSRERVLKAINHVEPDRVPLDLGGTAASGINVTAYIALKRELGLEANSVRVFDVFGMMAQIDEEVIDGLDIDVMLIPSLAPRFGIPIDRWKPWRLPDGTPVHVPARFETVVDNDGGHVLMVGGKAVGKMPKDETCFSELANASIGTIDSLRDPPDPDTVSFSLLTEEDLMFREDTARRLRKQTSKALVVDLVDNLRWETSIPEWIYAMAADPVRTAELHDKKSRMLVKKVEQLAQSVGPYADIFTIYQDYGTQRSELISPDTFERLVVPYYKRVFDWIHEHTTWKVMFHSCGSIYRLIDKMIAMGVDILNPVQCEAGGMDPKRLKAEYGRRLSFWGGGVNTQSTLPFGSPEDVRHEVEERIAALSPGGGYVFAPAQDIQADVPAKNVLALYRAAREYGRYPTRIEGVF